jgi:large subunit ribosomal protein L9
MEIILKEDVQNLGRAMELVKVKTGFAHNYLFPRGLAVLATSSAKKQVLADRAKIEEVVLLGPKNSVVDYRSQVSDGGWPHPKSDLQGRGYDIDGYVLLQEPIKQLGMYTIKVQLHKEVETKIKLWIISDESK